MTIEDLAGNYEFQNPYGSLSYIDHAGYTTFGYNDPETEGDPALVNQIKVTTDGEYLYFSNFLGLSFYAVPDLEAGTVTIPAQYVTAPTNYSFTQCLFDSRMFAGEGETSPSFTDADAQGIVIPISENGDLSLYDAESASWNYIAYWGWGANYGYISGVFHKTGDIEADEDVKPILGTYTCTTFNGEWNSIWGSWDTTYNVWNKFDIETGEGIDAIGVDKGPFQVEINTLGGNEVEVNGLWWGGLTISGTYDSATKTITFPLQSVWGGYTLCNSSFCDVEVPTVNDVVPATAVFNEDGSVTLNYTLVYYTYYGDDASQYNYYAYLYAKQSMNGPAQADKELTIEDLAGIYELQYPYGSLSYIDHAGYTTFGFNDPETEGDPALVNQIKVTTDGEYLYFSNFLGLSFYAVPDLEAGTVTIPVQYVTAPTNYSFTQCLFDSRMFAGEGETSPSFTDADAQGIVIPISENGDLSLYDAESASWKYIAYWGWGANYGYISGVFHKTGDIEADEDVKPILGTYTCTTFNGEWNSIWGSWDTTYNVWNKFDIETGEGIDAIGVDKGQFQVDINTLGGNEVEVNGLWWGGLTISGTYDSATKTITFPLQSVWGGYTLCNSSFCDVEVPTVNDVVPATAVFNEDGSVTLNYTLVYYTYYGDDASQYNYYAYLYSTQVLNGEIGAVENIAIDNENAPVEYYNLQGMRVTPTAGGLYIVRQGNKVTKQILK